MEDRRNMTKNIMVSCGIDVDAVAGWHGSYGGEESPCDISHGDFAGRVDSPRLLRVFERWGIKTAWFIPGHSICDGNGDRPYRDPGLMVTG